MQNIEADLQARRLNQCAGQVPAGILNRGPDSPLRISNLLYHLMAIKKEHGDLAVLVEGEPLVAVAPTIWTEKDRVLAGAELPDCVNLKFAVGEGRCL